MARKSTVEFLDNSVKVKGAINDIVLNWLEETAGEIASTAKRECASRSVGADDSVGKQVANSYTHTVDGGEATAYVGSPLEQAYWEEWGTGSHADTAKNGGKPGRKGWWVYVKGGSGYHGITRHYSSRDEAEAVAAGMREDGYDAYATNGREPNYTLENAFKTVMEKAKKHLDQMLKGLESE